MKRLLMLMALSLTLTSEAAWSVVVPNELAGVEGNSGAIEPFTAPFVGGTNPPSVLQYYSMRYQQVYDASQFAALRPEGEFITHVCFRVDTRAGHPFDGVLRDVLISCSTTQKQSDGLSTNFSDNVGPDDTVVWRRAQLELGGGYFVGATPQPFEPTIALDRPFLYRPSNGNLLVDFRIFTYSNSFPTAPFDASQVVGDSISRVFSTNVWSSAGTTDTRGLVTEFSTIRIPELSLTRSNAVLQFRWWVYPYGFVLETTTNFGPSSSWRFVNEPVATNGAFLETTVPLEGTPPASFYRLLWLSWPSSARALTADQPAEQAAFTTPQNR